MALVLATFGLVVPTTQRAYADEPNAYPRELESQIEQISKEDQGFDLTYVDVNNPAEEKQKSGGGTSIRYMKFINAENGVSNERISTYCVNFDLPSVGNSKYNVGNQDIANGGKVRWIVQEGFPGKTVSDLAKASGASGLDKKGAITATQAAIWYYTNGIEPKSREDLDRA